MLKVSREHVAAMSDVDVLKAVAEIRGAEGVRSEKESDGPGVFMEAHYPASGWARIPDYCEDVGAALIELGNWLLDREFTVELISEAIDHHTCVIGAAEEDGHQRYTEGLTCARRGDAVARAFVWLLAEE